MLGLTRHTGIEGSAEAIAPLNEDEGTTKFEGKVVEQGSEKVAEKVKSVTAVPGEGLSIITKLALFGVIVGVCYAFVKAYSPRRSYAGRHGAYEKGGLP